MDNVISIKDFRFQTYKMGRRRLLRSLEQGAVSAEDRGSFALRQTGEFFRLARLRSGLSIDEVASFISLSPDELRAFEDGRGGKTPASLLPRLCARYGVEQDFQEFYTYLLNASSPEATATLRETRPTLEKMGLIRPKDW